MTRQQVCEEYTVKDGRIHDCGRFELQPVYVPHYWDIYLNGFADIDDGEVLKFKVTKEDRAEFPELKGRHWVSIRQTDQGFIEEI